ncbi:kinesin light chain-like [Malaya genurostris]|uniref:kinesin light chain-like n=1 Tax=Malaya genurostris TaxID=325434 RepID=UPI0026F3964D|nr:kinesin light chain-like [Malaya genurostris]
MTGEDSVMINLPLAHFLKHRGVWMDYAVRSHWQIGFLLVREIQLRTKLTQQCQAGIGRTCGGKEQQHESTQDHTTLATKNLFIMTQQELIADTKTVHQILEALRVEHLALASQFSESVCFDTEKSSIVQQNIDKIELGLGEVNLLLVFSSHLQSVDAENQKLRLQIRRMQQENVWLREELVSTQNKLEISETTVGQLQEEKKHLEFMATLKVYDESSKSEKSSEEVCRDLVGELFPPEEEPKDQSAVSSQLHHAEIPKTLRTIHDLAIQYASEGRYEIVVPLCKHALVDLEAACGRDHPDVATMLNILALVYRDQRKYKLAADLLNDALEIREKTLGENHPAVAATLNNLAVLYGKRGKYSEAEPYCKRALEIRERMLGKDHPDVAKQLNNLALLCQNQSKYEEVEVYYQRALQIYETKLGSDDPNVTITRNNLASCYQRQGKLKEAELLYKQFLTKEHESVFGAISAANKPIWQMAEDQEANMVKSKTADNTSYGIMGGWHKLGKVGSPSVQATLKRLISIYRKQGKHEAAGALNTCVGRDSKESTNGSSSSSK